MRRGMCLMAALMLSAGIAGAEWTDGLLEDDFAELTEPSPTVAPPERIILLKSGSEGEEVRILQLRLKELGGKGVKMLFVMELAGLKGREKLKDYDVESLIIYPGN